MTAQLLTSLVWSVIIMLPIKSTILEKSAEYLFSFMPNAPLLLKNVLIISIGISATYAIFRYFLLEKVCESTGSPKKNPDNIAPVAITSVAIISVIYIVLKINYVGFGLWGIPNIIILNFLVVFGLHNGAGKRAMADDIESTDELPAIQAEITDIPSDQIIVSEFTWVHNEDPYTSTGKTTGHSIKVVVTKELYDSSMELSRVDNTKNSYISYATQTTNNSIILSIAAQLREIAIKNNLCDFTELHLVFSFFSCFNYIEDENSEIGFEYTRYPAQTVADLGGDSIDIAVICCAVLTRLGYRAFISSINEHAFIGVKLQDSSNTPQDFLPVYNGVEMFVCEIAPASKESTEDKARKLEFWYNSNPEQGVAPAAFSEIVLTSPACSKSEEVKEENVPHVGDNDIYETIEEEI